MLVVNWTVVQFDDCGRSVGFHDIPVVNCTVGGRTIFGCDKEPSKLYNCTI